MNNASPIRWQFGWLPKEKVSESLFIRHPCAHLALLICRYVAKVLYTYILGYKVDIGHMEAVNLISSHKYSEKQIVSFLFSMRGYQVSQSVTVTGISRSHTADARELRLSSPCRQFYTEGPG